MANSTSDNIAVFIDYENFGSQEAFDTKLLIDKLKERGRLIVKKAYADWGRFAGAKRQMLENSVELIELPSHSRSKNLADIKLVVDALETAITREYIDTIVVVSGDSDYTPLISKLREYNKYVIVVGARKQVSKLLVGYCDELIFYSSLVGEMPVEEGDLDAAYDLLVRAINYLEDQGIETRSSQIKSYMKQLDSSFNESNYGFSRFKRFVEKASQDGLVSLKLLEHGDYLAKLLQRDDLETGSLTRQEGVMPSSLVYLVCWAMELIRVGGSPFVSLSEIGSAIRQLDPSFELQQYGYSRNRGLKAVIQDMEKQELVRMEYDGEKNRHYVYPESKLKEFVKRVPSPEGFQRLRYENMSAKLGLTSDLSQIGRFIEEATSVLAESQSKSEGLTISQLLDICRQRLNEIGESYTASNRVINTILGVCAIKGESGDFITEIEDGSTISSIEPVDLVLGDCAQMIQAEIRANYQEHIESEALKEPPRVKGFILNDEFWARVADTLER